MSDQWINVSNDKLLAQKGITCGRAKIERGIRSLFSDAILEACESGLTADEAREKVEATQFREGENRARKRVWQIHASMIPSLNAWIENENRWISANNYDRLKALNITNGSDHLSELFREIYQEEVGARIADGIEVKQACDSVMRQYVREGFSEQGNPVWQIHESAIGLLKEKIMRPDWINSNARTYLRPYGFSAHAPQSLPILRQHYVQLCEQLQQERGLSADEAAMVVDSEYMHPATSRGRLESFDIRVSYLPNLLEACPTLRNRRPGDWLSSTSTRLHQHGIHGRGETIERAMRGLQEDAIFERIKQGMPPDEAASKVEAEIVGQHVGHEGRMVWKVHESGLDALREIYTNMPHYDAYKGQMRSPVERS